MGDHPEMTMVRRFRGLNARNLLCLQAELVKIETDLLRCERDDSNDRVDPYRRQYAVEYSWLVTREAGNKQLDLVNKMRVKPKEYSKSLRLVHFFILLGFC